MFAGHMGAALAIGRIERRVNVGWFIAAALLLDVLLWLFILLGWESVTIPADFHRSHQPQFNFPYSHGLLAGVVWAALAGVAVLIGSREALRRRAAALVAAAVFSHWVLDAAVHRRELPLTGPGSFRVGLAGWDHLPLALAVEAALVIAGLWLFIPAAPLKRSRAIALVLLSLIALSFTLLGMTVAPPPPSASTMATGSLATLGAVCALALWLGMPAQSAGTAHEGQPERL
jgi:hypothetical protein